jgi:uncharacterized membrane protein YqjE
MSDRPAGQWPDEPQYRRGTGAGMARESQRSTAEIMGDIVSNIQEIIRSEVRLAKTELKEEASKLARAGLMMVVGGVLGFYALGFLLVTIMNAIALAVPVWAASLIVTFLLVAATAVFIGVGRSRMKEVHPPQKTIQSVKENVEWARNQTR